MDRSKICAKSAADPVDQVAVSTHVGHYCDQACGHCSCAKRTKTSTTAGWVCSDVVQSNPDDRQESTTASEEETEEFDVQILPEEVWILIFRCLGACDLKSVRLSCRTWNQIVGNTTALMDKLPLVFQVESSIPKGKRFRLDAMETITASSSRYTIVGLKRVNIDTSELCRLFQSFWTNVAESLHTVAIVRCGVSFTEVLSTLKLMRNLKRLDYHNNQKRRQGDILEADFKMEKMEHLSLVNTIDEEILETFNHICPCLKTLKLHNDWPCKNQVVYSLSVANFVQKSRATLRIVQLDYMRWIIDRMIKLRGLQLERVTFGSADLGKEHDEANYQLDIIEFTRFYPTIQYLNIEEFTVDISTLVEVGTNLPNLRCLQIRLEEDETLSFLSVMPQLESLLVFVPIPQRYCDYDFEPDPFEEYFSNFTLDGCSPTLAHLHFKFDFAFSNIRLMIDQLHHPNMKSIRFDVGTVQSSDILHYLELITQTKFLQCFYLETTNFIVQEAIIPPRDVSNLRVLKLNLDCIDSNVLIALIRMCPSLEELYLAIYDFDVTEALVEICQNAKFIQVLTIISASITASSLRYLVANRGARLRRFNYDTPESHVDEAVEILKGLRGVEVYCFNRHGGEKFWSTLTLDPSDDIFNTEFM